MNIVRFAPSPTGFLHIGGARTCLFNWLFARSTQGKFVLRIEDTDLNRSEKQYVDEILDSLKWLGLNWDELYYQSKRFNLYQEYAFSLLNSGKAYKEGTATIFKVPKNTQVTIYDLIHGKIVIDTEQIKDQVLIKSDGSPAYNFCCVLDDALMGITHIIRGDDHIANTPKQILLYEALGFKLPKFVHIPMILGEDKTRLSKRHGATSISEYKRQGYLPDAIVNYLALLGWSSGNNREIFNLQALAKEFSIKRINKTAAIFDLNRLKWVNGYYIKNLELQNLVELLVPYLEKQGYITEDFDWLRGLVKLYKTRFQTLPRFLELTKFFFEDSVDYQTQAKDEFLKSEQAADYLEKLKTLLEQGNFSTVENIEHIVRTLVQGLNISASTLIHPARVALTGGTVSPGIFEIIYFLGKEKCVKRLSFVIEKIRNNWENTQT
ncbi:MAG: glutamate--tRNA ligase [Candidatus Omnitrophota bacterium]|nr:MAG: glutamate--tRNA ligase [Candidatus Omnitrophota bacterium]